MTDIHCHLLFGVDDGAKDIEESIAMLQIAADQGITDIILTPHYRHGMFGYPLERIRSHFDRLQPEAAKRNIRLYLGCEYHVNSHLLEYLEAQRVLSLAQGEFVLTEYSNDTAGSYVMERSMLLLRHGYIPVIAHIERYACFRKDLSLAEDLHRQGVWLQINADAILGKEGFQTKRFCKKVLDRNLIDVVASDSHDTKKRRNHLGECYDVIVRRYGEKRAKDLLERNPRIIVGRS